MWPATEKPYRLGRRGAEMLRVMIAGGGTGGHLFPGVAVAEEVRRRDSRAEVLFIGTGRPVEAEVLRRRGLPHKTITAAGLKGKGVWGQLKSLSALPLGIFQAYSAIRNFKPEVVLGVGGYVSGPVGLAAWLAGVPSALHEQNSIPGLTNRLLGRWVDLVFISFESSRDFFPAGKTHLTGNPLRAEILEAAGRDPQRTWPGFTVLVAGGSQGAHAVNTASVTAMGLVAQAIHDLRVIHQTGEKDWDMVREAYGRLNISTEVKPFFPDMHRVYLEADLVIGRAGAMTIAEIAVLGKPTIFIPLPTAADNHQEINARSLVEIGAAEMIRQADLTPQALGDMVIRLAKTQAQLKSMALAAKTVAKPNAAKEICDLCATLLKNSNLAGMKAAHVQ